MVLFWRLAFTPQWHAAAKTCQGHPRRLPNKELGTSPEMRPEPSFHRSSTPPAGEASGSWVIFRFTKIGDAKTGYWTPQSHWTQGSKLVTYQSYWTLTANCSFLGTNVRLKWSHYRRWHPNLTCTSHLWMLKFQKNIYFDLLRGSTSSHRTSQTKQNPRRNFGA